MNPVAWRVPTKSGLIFFGDADDAMCFCTGDEEPEPRYPSEEMTKAQLVVALKAARATLIDVGKKIGRREGDLPSVAAIDNALAKYDTTKDDHD